MVAYRRFQRFDYIIKGRNCDWFQSIPVLACITKQANGSFFLLPSSRASRSFWASRKMSRSPRLAHEAPAMQAIPLWSNECCSFDITIENGFFSFIPSWITKHANKRGFTAGVTWRRGSWENERSVIWVGSSALHYNPILWLPHTRCSMSRVLVTGASGFLAMHVVKQLVDSGEYIVRGTVRSLANETKVKPLKELSSENDKYPLELVEADLTKKETWVEWVVISKGLVIPKQLKNNAYKNELRFGVILTPFSGSKWFLTKRVLADWISINEICKVTQKVLLELSPVGYLEKALVP